MSVPPRRPPGRAAREDVRGCAASLPSDDELVAGLCTGDVETFARLVDAWTPVMLRVARAHLSTDEAAAEAVRETWLAAIAGVGRFRGTSSLQTWVFRILDGIVRTRKVRERRLTWCGGLRAVDCDAPTVDPRRFHDAEPDTGRWAEPPAAWPAGRLTPFDGRLRAVVENALHDLPPRQRIVVELRDLYGRGGDEVCALLEITPAHQRMLLHRGRAAVRAQVDDYLASAEERVQEGEAS